MEIQELADTYWESVQKLFTDNNDHIIHAVATAITDTKPVEIGTVEYNKEKTTVYLVDGSLISVENTMDFVEGGNDQRYDWIPKNQIYLDAYLHRKQLPFVCVHEAIERYLMKHEKMSYNKAHNIANKHERLFRLEALKKKGKIT